MLVQKVLTEDEVCGKGNKPIVQHQAMESPVKRIFTLLIEEPISALCVSHRSQFLSSISTLCLFTNIMFAAASMLLVSVSPLWASSRARATTDKKLPPPTIIVRSSTKPLPPSTKPILQHSMKQAFAIEAGVHAETALTHRRLKRELLSLQASKQGTSKSQAIASKQSDKKSDRLSALQKAGAPVQAVTTAEEYRLLGGNETAPGIQPKPTLTSQLKPTHGRYHFVGEASFYAGEFLGRNTSNGEVYDGDDLTAAHRDLPFGALVQVKNLKNGRTIVVRINDRGPFKMTRVLDLSPKAADSLGIVRDGIALVECTVLRDKCAVQFAQMR